MDPVTRCLHCGKRMIPVPSYSGRTELKCVFCDKQDPMETPALKEWANGPLAQPSSEKPPKRACSEQAFRHDVSVLNVGKELRLDPCGLWLPDGFG